jgi:hypothetical protein
MEILELIKKPKVKNDSDILYSVGCLPATYKLKL